MMIVAWVMMVMIVTRVMVVMRGLWKGGCVKLVG